MLTLVHPRPNGQDPPKRRPGRLSDALSLTAEEAARLRLVIRNVTQHHGSLTKLAARLGVTPAILTRKRAPGAGLAVALARALNLSLDGILFAGKLVRAGTCPTCGSRPAQTAKGGAS
jgi:hypothetical protein